MKSLQLISAIAVTLVAVSGCSAHVAIEPITPGETSSAPYYEVATNVLQDKTLEGLTSIVGTRPDSVECEGPLEAVVGATQRCILSIGADRVGLTVKVNHVVGSDVDFQFEVDPEKMP